MSTTLKELKSQFINKMLYTRKQMFSFVKLYLRRKYNIDFNVRRLKEVMYGENKPTLDYEKEALYLFGLFSNLLNNKALDLFCKQAAIIKDVIDFDNVSKTVIDLYECEEKIIYVFMIMDYLLILNNLPIINPYRNRYDEFVEAIKTKDGERLDWLLVSELEEAEALDIDYYANCFDTNKELIQQFVEENKKDILENGKIKHLYLFGSYASGLTRYDSDIDMLVITKDDLTFEEKKDGINYIKQFISKRFNRIVDIHETTIELLEIDNKRINNKVLLI